MPALVLQSDFGTSDGAVAAMKGVAVSVAPELRIFDLSHHIPPFDVWEASFRLMQTIDYWPDGTVFVSVVDPGVGSDRRSVIARTAAGSYVVTPDNGTLTKLAEHSPIVAVREIDERINRLPRSGESYTFHGRDIYAYTAARLASGVITFEEVGPEFPVEEIVTLDVDHPVVADGEIVGSIEAHDVRYGSLWTNIPRALLAELDGGLAYGDHVAISVSDRGRLVHESVVRYSRSFAEVPVGKPLAYVNSLDDLAVAINRGSFAAAYSIGAGPGWRIRVRRAADPEA